MIHGKYAHSSTNLINQQEEAVMAAKSIEKQGHYAGQGEGVQPATVVLEGAATSPKVLFNSSGVYLRVPPCKKYRFNFGLSYFPIPICLNHTNAGLPSLYRYQWWSQIWFATICAFQSSFTLNVSTQTQG